jgi:putative addiction module antidote
MRDTKVVSTQALTIRAIGSSSGVVLPKELLEALNLQRGDQLLVSKTKDGLLLRAMDETFAKQMALARNAMHKDRAILRELAK